MLSWLQASPLMHATLSHDVAHTSPSSRGFCLHVHTCTRSACCGSRHTRFWCATMPRPPGVPYPSGAWARELEAFRRNVAVLEAHIPHQLDLTRRQHKMHAYVRGIAVLTTCCLL